MNDTYMAHDIIDAATLPSRLAQAVAPAEPVLPTEPLWDHKGNVIHGAVDRLREAQRATAPAEPVRAALAEVLNAIDQHEMNKASGLGIMSAGRLRDAISGARAALAALPNEADSLSADHRSKPR